MKQNDLFQWTVFLAAWPLSTAASPAQRGGDAVLARQAGHCDFRVPAGENESCESMARAWGLSIGEFRQRNPSASCGRLTPGALYCIDWSEGPSSGWPPSLSPPRPTTLVPSFTQRPTFPGTTIWPSRTARPTTLPTVSSMPPRPPPPPPPVPTMPTRPPPPPPPPPTPTPPPFIPGKEIQPGTVPYCRRYHEVVNGDNCWVVAERYRVSEGDLHAWNPQFNGECTNMWLGYRICVGV